MSQSPSLADPVKLPCGLVLPNRLVKAAMAEALAKSTHEPNSVLVEAYNKWSQGGWGAILTGNVQVDIKYLGQYEDPSLPHDYRGKEIDQALLAPWKKYAETSQKHGTPTIVQLCHPGRQSVRGAGHRSLFEPSIAPSPIALKVGDGWMEKLAGAILFPQPREMTQMDIDRATGKFVDAARVMADAGFSGIQLHGAHGYLIDQFLNSKTNHRTDAYGGSAEKRAKFVLDIFSAVRKAVPPTFCVGIKLNSADHQSESVEDVLTQIKLLVDAGIDFMEISGGSYENPKMMTGPGTNTETKSDRTKAREAFFLEFANQVRIRYPSLHLMVTGGFRSRGGMVDALQQNACDLIGIGRPSTITPEIPHLLLDRSVPDDRASFYLNKVPLPWVLKLIPIRILGIGAETLYFTKQIGRMGRGLLPIAP